MKFLFRFADHRRQESLAARKRRERFQLFKELLDTLPGPITVLDIGGTMTFWQKMGFTDEDGIHIVLLNLDKVDLLPSNFTSVAGDASDMPEFRDREFDVVFSNSVIEHLGEYDRQVMMANEIKRVGKRYFVQTPNRFFPVEPHFLFPFFQFLPTGVRVFLLRHFDMGWIKKTTDRQAAARLVKSIRLLSEKEFTGMFEGATLYREKLFGLAKSFVVYGGW